MNGNRRKHIPQLKPPDENLTFQIRDKGKLILRLLLITVLTLPAILMAFYRRIFPGEGKSLKNKVALVTGAGRGLGRALAIGLAKEGCKLACVDINEVSVAETAALIARDGHTAKSYVTNVALPEEVAKLAARVTEDLGPVDVLVNNAGLVVARGMMDGTNDEIKGLVSVNFLSHFWMIRSFLPSMKERNTGHIVAISSMSAFVGIANLTGYISCKWGLTGLMQSLREELRDIPGNGIKTTTVHPYFINTSEDYTKKWNIPLPELTIEEVVEPVIKGIKLDHQTISIPEHMYYSIVLMKLMPAFVRDLGIDSFKISFTLPNNEDRMNYPVTPIIEDTLHNGT